MDYRNQVFVYMALALAIIMHPLSQTQSTVLGQTQTDQQVEFRIDTDIYSDESKPPIHTTQTMFLSTRTVEWDDTNRRLLIVDYPSASVTIADLSAQKKCRIDMQQLEDRLSNLRSQMTSQEIATWTSSGTAQLDASGFYEMSCERSSYRFKTKAPAKEKMAIEYAEFADWSVKMHAVNPPYKPPLLRLQLNTFLKDQRELPSEIRLRDLRSTNSKPIVARLIVQDKLTGQDMDRVRDWEVLTATLKSVTEVEYFRQAGPGPSNKTTLR